MGMMGIARDLVLRAREGDQNAMGMIAMIRKSAAASNAPMRPKIAYRMIQDYIKKNPVGGPSTTVHGDPPLVTEAHPESVLGISEPSTFFESFLELCQVRSGVLLACVLLADGAPLTAELCRDYVSAIPQTAEGAKATHAIQTARRMQAIRDPKVPLKILSPMVGWELD